MAIIAAVVSHTAADAMRIFAGRNGIVAAAVLLCGCDASPAPAPSGNDLLLAEAECSTCRIVIDTAMTLTDQPSDEIAPLPVPAVDSRGRVLVANADLKDILVFDTTGTQISRFGKPGSGPGELEQIGTIAVLRGDTIAVIDAGRNHILFFSSEYQFAREAMIDRLDDCCVLPLVLAGSRLLIPQPGGRVVQIGADGSRSERMSLLANAPGDSSEAFCAMCGMTLLGRSASPDLLWVARVNEYKLRLVDSAGVAQRTITRSASWFPKWISESLWENGKPVPRLVGLHEASDSILWALIQVPRAAPPPPPSPPTPEMSLNERRGRSMAGYFAELETRVEAIDLASGKLLASAVFVEAFFFLSNGRIGLLRVDASGDPHWSFGKLELKGRAGGG